MEEWVMELSKRIVAAREYAGMDIGQASQSLSVDPSVITAWEVGEAEPSLELLQKMCSVYDVSSDFLLLGNDSNGKYLPKKCLYCGVQLPKEATFCPNCGKTVGFKEETAPRVTACSIVLNLGAGNFNRASDGVRIFYENPKYCKGCICPNGRSYDNLNEAERAKMIDNIIAQLKCGNSTLLCRNLSYDIAVEMVKMFYKRANAFLFYDSDGTTLEELGHATPQLKYIIGDPPLDGEKKGLLEKVGLSTPKRPQTNSQQTSQQQAAPQQPIIIRQNIGGGCLAELAGLALVLLIIILIDSL